MIKLNRKSALLICAVMPMGLLVSGCGAVGYAGYKDVVAGNWTAAKEDFSEDYSKLPDHPIAQFNMGASYHHDGDINKADTMFSQAVVTGRQYFADLSLEPQGTSASVGQHACTRLHRDNKLDTNCGDQIAIELPPAPPPAPVAMAEPEPAPAIEAQATTPKQDRN